MSSNNVNPIIPGFALDPSIIQIDVTFFVNSTFHVFPGLPIYASKDLISWKHIGNALHRQSQLSLARSSTNIWPQDDTGKSLLATGGLYAPTIRHHNGIIYIVCTNIIHTPTSAKDIFENFIISTTDIWSNEWSDPIYFEFEGIDPSILFDDDGRSYIQGSAAPARGTNEYIRYTGYCDVIQDQKGKWWGVCLGVKLNPVLDGKELVRAAGTSRLTAAPMVDFLYIRGAILIDHAFPNDDKTITLTPSKEDISQWEKPVTFVGKRQRELEGTASVSMHHVSSLADAQLEAGLAYYKDEHRYVKLIYSFSTKSFVLQVVNNAKAIKRTMTHNIEIQDVVDLRVEYTESSLLFSYRVVGLSPWRPLGVVNTLDLTSPDFVGPIIGIFATSQAENLQVQFNDLVVE
ncbi:Arabinanase/levansucrase/invertase [Acephala macrosclerotiorum]|nr:Arabinanase/levansucrase/invertase [Acephala macrosclerotiorum]